MNVPHSRFLGPSSHIQGDEVIQRGKYKYQRWRWREKRRWKRERGSYVVLCGRLQPPNYRRLPWKEFASRGDLCLCQVDMKHAVLDHRGPVCPCCCPTTWQPQRKNERKKEREERGDRGSFKTKNYVLLNSISCPSFTPFRCAAINPDLTSFTTYFASPLFALVSLRLFLSAPLPLVFSAPPPKLELAAIIDEKERKNKLFSSRRESVRSG